MRRILQWQSRYQDHTTQAPPPTHTQSTQSPIMDYPKGQGSSPYSSSPQNLPGRRSREERRSLSETLADGTSKFFSSMVAKKNGLFTDISNKIENTFAAKTDTISNSTGSDASGSPPTTPPAVPNTPPPRPPPPKRLPSMGSSQERTTTVFKRMSSVPAYSRTDSRPENEMMVGRPPSQGGRGFSKDDSNNKYNIGGMNVSFDQPIYLKQADSNQKPHPENKPRIAPAGQNPEIQSSTNYPSSKSSDVPSDRIQCDNRNASNSQIMQHNAVNSSKTQHRAPSTHNTTTGSSGPPQPQHKNNTSSEYSSSPPSSMPQQQQQHQQPQPTPAPRTMSRSPAGNTSTNNTIPVSNNSSNKSPQSPRSSVDEKVGERGMENTYDSNVTTVRLRRDQNRSSSSGEWSDRRQTSEDSNKSFHNDGRHSDSSTSSTGKPSGTKKTPKLATTRRSSTVDEMLFDDYIDPEVDAVIRTGDTPPENLISFEPDGDVSRSDSSETEGGMSRGMAPGTSVDSSDVEYGGVVPRSGSMGSDKSWSSSYSVDSQPDDLTLECMEFMKAFVDKVFQLGEEISQTDKAKFGELCQQFPGRLWFSRYVNSQRVHNKCVTESSFFRLMQYFAVCLFECNEAEDYSPAKTLMNMCFTFFYEAPSMNGGGQSPTGSGQNEKVFLYTYMREQPIWQSLRFWNAAFFDAVQCERSRRPMPTNSAENETVTDDRQFQENITFGQLGTFACNMRSFGLSRELCLEFLRKQSTIANLRKDQVKLLKDNIERVREN